MAVVFRSHNIALSLLAHQFLCAFAKLRKATISFVMSVRPSAWNNSPPTGRIFMKFDIWEFFENLSRKIEVSFKPDKNNRYFTWRPIYIFYLAQFVLEWETFQTKKKSCRENQNTHFVFSNFFISKIVPFMRKCGKMWYQPDKPRMTICYTPIACWIPKATNTHTGTM